MTREAQSWWVVPTVRPDPTVRLFCFPYSGSGASIYRAWERELPGDVELCAVQLPGREERIDEAAVGTMDALVAAIADNLAPDLDRPFAFYGHSFGGFLAFEVARLLRRRGAPMPRQLLIGAAAAPSQRTEDKLRAARPEMLRALPEQVRNDAELMALATAIFQADFAALQSWRYRDEEPLPCPITVYAGADDPYCTIAEAEAWRGLAGGEFAVEVLPAGHFFLHDHRDRLLALVASKLAQIQ